MLRGRADLESAAQRDVMEQGIPIVVRGRAGLRKKDAPVLVPERGELRSAPIMPWGRAELWSGVQGM